MQKDSQEWINEQNNPELNEYEFNSQRQLT